MAAAAASANGALPLPVHSRSSRHAPFPTSSEVIHTGNLVLVQNHLRDLKKRAKATLASMRVPAIRRVRFDGVTMPEGCTTYFWFEPTSSRGRMNPKCPPDFAIQRANTPPPPGVRRWLYLTSDVRAASNVVTLEWDISDDELIRVFAYWNNKSVMQQLDGLFARNIERCRPAGRRMATEELDASPVQLWLWDLAEHVHDYATNWLRAHNGDLYTLKWGKNGWAILPPLTLDPADITLITKHELNVIQRRSADLLPLLRLAAEPLLEKYRATVDEDWRAARRQAAELAELQKYDAIEAKRQKRREDWDAYEQWSEKMSQLEKDNGGKMPPLDMKAAAEAQRWLDFMDSHEAEDSDDDDELSEPDVWDDVSVVMDEENDDMVPTSTERASDCMQH